MKNFFIAIAFLFSVNMNSQSVLSLSTTIQEQNQWCWSACSNCILRHYGVNTTQCQLAEYTRTVATWHNFGTVDCCITATAGCNYWNYNWGYAGSIQDLLSQFGSISVSNISNTISISVIQTEINNSRPFVIRWGWTSGGGHFIVGEGYDASNNIYYMNPWPGEGSKMATYSWVVNDGVHSWTHTQKMAVIFPSCHVGAFSLTYRLRHVYVGRLSWSATGGLVPGRMVRGKSDTRRLPQRHQSSCPALAWLFLARFREPAHRCKSCSAILWPRPNRREP